MVEHLTGLAQLPDTGFRFTAAPPAVAGARSTVSRDFASWDEAP